VRFWCFGLQEFILAFEALLFFGWETWIDDLHGLTQYTLLGNGLDLTVNTRNIMNGTILYCRESKLLQLCMRTAGVILSSFNSR
jgi:hypothetical protein